MDLVWIYTYCSGDASDEYVSKTIDAIVEERFKPKYADNLSSNLPEFHCKLGHQVHDNMINVLATMLGVLVSTNTITGLLFYWTHGM